jgi:hypothetical protein
MTASLLLSVVSKIALCFFTLQSAVLILRLYYNRTEPKCKLQVPLLAALSLGLVILTALLLHYSGNEIGRPILIVSVNAAGSIYQV